MMKMRRTITVLLAKMMLVMMTIIMMMVTKRTKTIVKIMITITEMATAMKKMKMIYSR